MDTAFGKKNISVIHGDILELNVPLDVMMVSSFYRDYYPLNGTMLGALNSRGVSVDELSKEPELDLRDLCNIWLSKSIIGSDIPISRIGCVELSACFYSGEHRTLDITQTLKSFFAMLELASCASIKIEKLGLIIPGTGNQGISVNLVMVPLLNECLRFMHSNEQIRDIYIIERGYEKAHSAALALKNSYSLFRQKDLSSVEKLEVQKPLAFISYSSADKNIADNLCSKLEQNGVRVWYAPRNIDTADYASAIVKAITNCTHFIVIISHNSLQSQHVLNEIDLAFQELKRKIRFYPLKLDSEEMGPAFRYYLSRQHWMDASCPPLEARLDQFVGKIKAELDP